jgi:hypothetical protein
VNTPYACDDNEDRALRAAPTACATSISLSSRASSRALGYFNEALKANAQDALSTLYVERCDILLKTPPKDWNGVWVLGSK